MGAGYQKLTGLICRFSHLFPIKSRFFRSLFLSYSYCKLLKKAGSFTIHPGTALLAAMVVLFTIPLRAQDYDVGLYGGGSYYLGDLNPGVHFQSTQLAFGALLRYNLDDRWSVKVSAYRG